MNSVRLSRLRAASYPAIMPSAAVVALTAGPLLGMRPAGLSAAQWWYALLLCALVPLARRFPVHLSRNVVITLLTPQLVLLVLLLPPPDAIVVGAVAWLAGDLLERRRTGFTTHDIASFTGACFMALLLAAGLKSVAHQIMPDGFVVQTLALSLAGVAFVSVNILGAALWAVQAEGGTVPRLCAQYGRDSWAHEAGQLVIAGAGLALVNFSPAALLALPALAIPAHRFLRHDLETHVATREMVIAMADAVDQRDPSTVAHSRRVADHVAAMAHALRMGAKELELVVTAARVHDIGKRDIPSEILFKNGPLSPEERRSMQSHVTLGAQMLAGYRDFRRGASIVLHHHERWDGQGYPDGLSGVSIPEGARIIAVADSYDAMTSDRPYRPGMSHEAAIAALLAGRGSQWEGRLVDVFLATLAARAAADVDQAGTVAVRAVCAPEHGML